METPHFKLTLKLELNVYVQKAQNQTPSLLHRLLVTGYCFRAELNSCPNFAGNSLFGARGHLSTSTTTTGGGGFLPGFSTPPAVRLFVAALAIMVT